MTARPLLRTSRVESSPAALALVSVAAALNTSGALKDQAGPTAGSYGWSATNQRIPVLGTPVPVTSTHNITGIGTSTMWGNGPISATANAGKDVTLECGSCHDPHGNGNYRILRSVPNDSGAATGVTIPDATAKSYTTVNYWLAGDGNVPLDPSGVTTVVNHGQTVAVPDGYLQNVSAWCTTCHTRYLAPSESGGTSSGDAVFTYRHRSDNPLNSSPNCVQCHVAHGSNAVMGSTGQSKYNALVKLPDGTIPATYPVQVALPGITVTGSADSRLLRADNRGICIMCHDK